MKLRWQDPEYRAMMLKSVRRKEAFTKIAAQGRVVAMSRVTGKERPQTAKSQRKPTMQDIAWAAGFMEGEGHFRPRSQVTAVQVNREPLERLLALFGGSILVHSRPDNPKGWSASSQWACSGARARGFAMTVFPFLSKKRQEQILRMVMHVG